MKTKTASHTLDTLPPLTEAQEAHLKALAARPESEIDYSDIPAPTEDQLQHARRGVFYRPVKHQITARVDADVLASPIGSWLAMIQIRSLWSAAAARAARMTFSDA